MFVHPEHLLHEEKRRNAQDVEQRLLARTASRAVPARHRLRRVGRSAPALLVSCWRVISALLDRGGADQNASPATTPASSQSAVSGQTSLRGPAAPAATSAPGPWT